MSKTKNMLSREDTALIVNYKDKNLKDITRTWAESVGKTHEDFVFIIRDSKLETPVTIAEYIGGKIVITPIQKLKAYDRYNNELELKFFFGDVDDFDASIEIMQGDQKERYTL